MMLQIRDLHKTFDNHSGEVLKGVSLSVDKGDVTAILGPSGSGKSTMLRCINAMEKITGGDILFNGKSIANMKNLPELRKDIGMVFQHFNLFPHMTVLKNVMYAPVTIRGISFKPMEPLILVALIYFAITFIISTLLRHFEKKMKKSYAR